MEDSTSGLLSSRPRIFPVQGIPDSRMDRLSLTIRLQPMVCALGVAAFALGHPLPWDGAIDPAIEVRDPIPHPHRVAILNGEALTYETVDEMAIHDGDMVLGTAGEVAEATRKWRSRKPISGGLPKKRDISPEGPDHLWPDGIIPYEIEPGFTARALQDIDEAIHEWNSKTVLTLVERTTESSFVQFRPWSSTPSSPRCSAVVGKADGARGVWLRSPAGCGVQITVHEIGHAAGLYHEHQRKDRDHYVRIVDLLHRGPSRFSYAPNRPLAGPYDYASVMHYFGTFESIPPGVPFQTARWLSAGDIDGVARMYGMPPSETTISTNPPGLEIIVDGERVVTPATFDWAAGSEHTMHVPSPQTFGSERYIFARWNDEGGSNRTITTVADTTWYEANFVVQKQVFACAVPDEAGDVTISPESSGGFYTVGTPIEFRATSKPESGLQFRTWYSTNTTNRHGLSANPASIQSVNYFRGWTAYRANFESGPFFLIDSNVDTVRIDFDGGYRYLPWALRPSQFQDGVVVEAPETSQVSSGLRYRFKGWSDGGGRSHRVDVPAAGGSLRLDLAREYLVYARAVGRIDRDDALQVWPESQDNYYEEDTQVTLTAVPTADLHFAGWIGALSSRSLVQTIRADAPKALWPIFSESLPLTLGEPMEVTLEATDQLELHSGSNGYNVLVPSDATELTVTFESTTPGAEVDLYVNLHPVIQESEGDNGPTESIIADFEATTAGASETITIDRRSIPALLDGIYYIGLAVHPTQTEIRGVLSVEIRRSGISGASPEALTFISGTTSNPESQTIRLTHQMNGSVRYRINSSLASVTVSPQEWVQTEAGTTDITVAVNSAGQEIGSHHGTLTVVRVSEAGSATDDMLPMGIEIPVMVGIIDDNASRAETPKISLVNLLSRPDRGDTYTAGEELLVQVRFAEPIEVTGNPSISLSIGDQTRQAQGAGNFTSQCGGYQRILFRYAVQAEDMDGDGIGISADALTLNGGTIRSLAGVDANLDLGRHAITAARGHRVDGSLVIAPKVVDMEIWRGPQNGTSYGAGEWIWVWVDLDTEVEVIGDPELALTIGNRTRQATLHAADPITLWFRYAVQAGDLDADGIGIASDALTLNGGTIQSLDGVDADLDLGGHAIANSSRHAVNGNTPAVLVVRHVEINSRPLDGEAYGRGEEIVIVVAFTGPIQGSGPVQLVVDIGGYKNRAIYNAYTPSALWFTYRVQSYDNDPDGISVPADGLLLNSGSITSPAGARVVRNLGNHAITNAEEHKVRGGR